MLSEATRSWGRATAIAASAAAPARVSAGDPDEPRAYHEVPPGLPRAGGTGEGQGGGRQAEADDRHVQLAHAYLHLALYYLALTDSDSAKCTFKVLLRLYRDRRLNPDVYPPRVIDLFEEARREVVAENRTTAAEPRGPAGGWPGPQRPGSTRESSS